MPHLHQYTRENLLALARDLANTYGESLTLTAFRRETGLSQHIIFDLCGSWCQLRVDIGLTPEAPRARNKLPTEKIRDQLRTAIEQHGPNLSAEMKRRRKGRRRKGVRSLYSPKNGQSMRPDPFSTLLFHSHITGIR